MNRNRSRKSSIVAVLALALVAAFAASAFTAENTVADSFAGDGAEAISGYTVSDVAYTVADDAITQVDFALASASAATYVAPSTLEVKLNDAGDWHTCTVDDVDDTKASCATTGETVADADNLRVVAAQ